MKNCVLMLIFVVLIISPAHAIEPDLEREQRLADEIVDTILDGDAKWLEADGRKFLSIFTEAEKSHGAVIILHGRGFHPDWVDTVNPLRVGLVEHGWTTLSLQMPVLEKHAKYYDYIPIFSASFARIESGIRFLRESGFKKIVLIAHSCGVHMAMAWVKHNTSGAIDAFVGLGMGATDYKQPMIEPFPLDRITVPVLDMYGSNDYPAVIRMAPERKAAIEKAAIAQSRQIVLPGADHYFTDKGDELTSAVAKWLVGLN